MSLVYWVLRLQKISTRVYHICTVLIFGKVTHNFSTQHKQLNTQPIENKNTDVLAGPLAVNNYLQQSWLVSNLVYFDPPWLVTK